MDNISAIKNKIKSLVNNQNSEIKSNPSFGTKIDEMLSSFPSNEEVIVQNIIEKNGQIIIELTSKNGEKCRITYNCSEPNEVRIIQDYKYDSSNERTIIEQKITSIPGIGFEYQQNTVYKTAENCAQYTHNEYAQTLRERYDKSGVMTKMKRNVLKPYHVQFAINDNGLSMGNHLFSARSYGNFEYSFNQNKIAHSLELSRISHDVVKVTSQGINNANEDITYEGYQLLGAENYITLPSYPYFLITAYDLLPGVGCIINSKNVDEIRNELNSANLTTEERKFLSELAEKNNREELSVDPSKSNGFNR